MNPGYKKIGEVEIVIGTMISLMVYGLSLILDSLVVGIFISPILESFFTFGMWLFFKSHGDPHANKLGANLAQYLSNAIPFIPSIIIAFLVKVYFHNHPKAAGAAGKNLNTGSKNKIIGSIGPASNEIYGKAA